MALGINQSATRCHVRLRPCFVLPTPMSRLIRLLIRELIRGPYSDAICEPIMTAIRKLIWQLVLAPAFSDAIREPVLAPARRPIRPCI